MINSLSIAAFLMVAQSPTDSGLLMSEIYDDSKIYIGAQGVKDCQHLAEFLNKDSAQYYFCDIEVIETMKGQKQ